MAVFTDDDLKRIRFRSFNRMRYIRSRIKYEKELEAKSKTPLEVLPADRPIYFNLMVKYDLMSEKMLNYAGLDLVLRTASKIPTRDSEDFLPFFRFFRNQSEWVIKFFMTIKPLLWPVWFNYIFEDQKIPLFPLRSSNNFEWFGFERKEVFRYVSLDPLKNFWNLSENPPSKELFLIEVKSLRVKEIILTELATYFSLPRNVISLGGK